MFVDPLLLMFLGGGLIAGVVIRWLWHAWTNRDAEKLRQAERAAIEESRRAEKRERQAARREKKRKRIPHH